MIARIALRSFVAQPVRTLVLASGFGLGIACMAGLLGVGDVILEQSRSPQLRGGGDLTLVGVAGEIANARYVCAQLLESGPLAGRVESTSPSLSARLYLQEPGQAPLAIGARAGIPSLERRMGDVETCEQSAWQDSEDDRRWISPPAGELLRAMDRFHPIPDLPRRAHSWAEWLYFNGRSGEERFYLTFLVGAEIETGRRRAGVRLQLERDGVTRGYSAEATVDSQDVLRTAPDLEIAGNRVSLAGMRYRVVLDLAAEDAGQPPLRAELELAAGAGNAFPPIEMQGADGWRSGYVVPVLAGELSGWFEVAGEPRLTMLGRGYHDHNWGYWEGVSWQWGQVNHDDIALLYGKIRPPADVADADRLPGFLVLLASDAPLGFTNDVRIEEFDRADESTPRRIEIVGRGPSFEVRAELEIRGLVGTRMSGAFAGETGSQFLQLDADYAVRGRVGGRRLDFTARGSAETFRSVDAR